jgi:endonuclease G, mitochondrial
LIERTQLLPFAFSLVLALCCQPSELALPVDSDIFTIGNDCVVCYDRRTHTARWVMETITWDDLQGNAARSDRFFVPSIPDEFRPSLNDYRGSGYDRGHLAPSANFRADQVAQDATFSLANMMPQDSRLNRGLWAELEQQIRDMVQPGVTVHVVTVPVWTAHKTGGMQHEMAGRVSVPTHCGKTVLVVDGNSLKMFAWIIPNEAPKRFKKPNDYRVRVDEFEIKSGIDVWSSLDDVTEKKLESAR